MLVLTSDITIGKFRFSGVNAVRIRRSLHNYVDTAVITIPDESRILRNNIPDPVLQTTAYQFNEGDKVLIKLGYDGKLNNEFAGFVKRKALGMPLQIECEGYAYQLRRNKITGSFKEISVKELLKKAVAGTDVTIRTDVDMPFTKVHYFEKTGADLIDWILKESQGALSAFFIEPSVLYCGLVYTPYSLGTDAFGLSRVDYRLGFNAKQDNGLKMRVPADDPTQVSYGKKMPKGTRIFSESQAKAAKKKIVKLLNTIPSKTWLQKLADEKEKRINYAGYQGYLNAFLRPYCLPGYRAYIEDPRYPDRNGVYVIESTEVDFGIQGAWRKVEIGPKIGFANDKDWKKYMT